MPASRGLIVIAAVAGVSIALNIFMVGGMLGHRFRGPPPAMDMERRFNSMLDSLPAADQPGAREVLDKHMADMVEKWRVFRQDTQHAMELLRADPADTGQLRAAFDRSNESSTAFRKALQETQIEMRGRISAEGAQALRGPGGPPPGGPGNPRRGPPSGGPRDEPPP